MDRENRSITSLDDVLRSVVEPFGPGAQATFAERWQAGQLYTGGWTFRVRGDPPGSFAYEYAVVDFDESKMQPHSPPAGLALEFANLLTPQKTETVAVISTAREAAAALLGQSGTRSNWDREMVQPAIVRGFLEKHGPLTDSFLRDGEDSRAERRRNNSRDARAAAWMYEFTRPVAFVQQSFDLSKKDIDEGTRLAWLMLDEVPQFSLLKVIALQAFSALCEGRDLTRCANPSCRRYFVHKRRDSDGCSPSCNNVLRVRRHRSKQRRAIATTPQPEGGSDG